MTNNKTVADVLEGAADLLEKSGAWTQGSYEKGHCYCLLGALAKVADVNPEKIWHGHIASDARYKLADVLPIRDSSEVVDWNDAPGRTQAEVVAKLREAAALAREQAA